MSNKVLIVEDELKYHQLYKELFEDSLTKNWYSLIFAETGEEAWDIVKKDRKQEISLIILDLKLENSDLDGVDFANLLAENHIDKKIIVWTAFPKWENSFSVAAKKNIIKIIKRTEYPHDILKDLCDTFIIGNQFEVPGLEGIDKDSKSLGYLTIRKLVKTLSADYRYKLIQDILAFFPVYILLDMEKNFSAIIRNILDEAMERDKLKQWLLARQKAGRLSEDYPPIEEVDDLMIEIIQKYKTKTNNYYEDYFIRGSHEGKRFSRYLPKELVHELPEEFKDPNSSKVNYKSAPRHIN